MVLTFGTRLGPYEVTGQIGVGGMGEVYRATDTNLGRQVAIKVLPEAFAHDPGRLARFEREAKTLASLNHPNIAQIHGLEKSGGMTALVMELVEGPTLADRIAEGAIPIEEALPIAKQIAEALEAAHEQGIIHRDLKPANIKVRPDGTVKVLDFGLAKAMEPLGGMSPGVSQAPTITTPAMMTGVGMILGTAAYMSPEQARGKVVDRRTDVWAFGCVVYEMLTGRRAFEGDEISDVLARILEREPDFTALSPATPASVLRLLRRCLIKDPRKRLPDVGTARLDIDEALTGSAPAVVPVLTARSFPRRATAAGLVAGLTIGAAIGAIGVWVARTPVPGLAAFTIETPTTARRDGFAISPDGRQLAFTALDDDGQQKLWLRPLESTAARALPGTERADLPFWSPDSRMVAFFTANELKRIDVAGGNVQTIAKTSSAGAAGGTWNEQNIILFSRGGSDGILRVAAGGGEPERLTTTETAAGLAGLWPTFLPGGRHFLYLKIVGPSIAENSQLMWRALDSADERVVRSMYSKAFYSPTGHLLFSLGGPVVTQEFDASNGTVSGDPVQLVGDTVKEGSSTSLAFSPAGVLAHRAGSASAQFVAQLSWVDRDGKVVSTVGAAADYRSAAIDRAGERIVANTGTPSDVWLIDSRRGTTSRITFDPANDSDPIFSPDGRWVLFHSGRQPAGIYRKASNSAGAEELVMATGPGTYPNDWSPDGRFLLYTGDNGKTTGLWVLPMTGDRKPFPYLATSAAETDGQFSPDGRWIAYTSYETGRAEVFVQDFPSTGAKFQVSVAGGAVPRWGRSGRELYFLAPADGRLMSVEVERTPDFRLGIPRSLFQTRLMNLRISQSRRYGVSPDGTRFMMNVPVGEDALAPITVLLNWQALLHK